MKVKFLGDDWEKFGIIYEVLEETERTYVTWDVNHPVVLAKVDCEIIEV